MLDVAQGHTHSIDWSSIEGARAMLDQTDAFAGGEEAKLTLEA